MVPRTAARPSGASRRHAISGEGRVGSSDQGTPGMPGIRQAGRPGRIAGATTMRHRPVHGGRDLRIRNRIARNWIAMVVLGAVLAGCTGLGGSGAQPDTAPPPITAAPPNAPAGQIPEIVRRVEPSVVTIF